MPETAPAYVTNGDHRRGGGHYTRVLDRLMRELDELIGAAGGQLSQVPDGQLDAWDNRRRTLLAQTRPARPQPDQSPSDHPK